MCVCVLGSIPCWSSPCSLFLPAILVILTIPFFGTRYFSSETRPCLRQESLSTPRRTKQKDPHRNCEASGVAKSIALYCFKTPI